MFQFIHMFLGFAPIGVQIVLTFLLALVVVMAVVMLVYKIVSLIPFL